MTVARVPRAELTQLRAFEHSVERGRNRPPTPRQGAGCAWAWRLQPGVPSPALAGRLTRAPDSGRPQTGRSSPRQARRRAAGPVAAPLCGYRRRRQGQREPTCRRIDVCAADRDRPRADSEIQVRKPHGHVNNGRFQRVIPNPYVDVICRGSFQFGGTDRYTSLRQGDVGVAPSDRQPFGDEQLLRVQKRIRAHKGRVVNREASDAWLCFLRPLVHGSTQISQGPPQLDQGGDPAVQKRSNQRDERAQGRHSTQ